MDVKASEQLDRPREHTMNEIIIEMLTHVSPLERQDLSVEQLEAVRAVLPTAYCNTNAEKAIDDTGKPADLNSALLHQDIKTIRVLDDLCVKFVKELIFENRIGKTKQSSATNELVAASQASTTGLQVQGVSSRESRVSKSIKEIELQLKAAVSADQPLAGGSSMLKPKSESLASVGSPQSKVQKSLPKPDTPGNASLDPQSIDVSQSNTSGTPPESEAPASTPTGPQVPEQSILKPDVPGNLNQDHAEEQLGIGLSQPKNSGAPPESEVPDSTLTGTQSLEQHSFKPGVAENPNRDDAEKHMHDPTQEEEKALQAPTPISTPTTSQIPLPVSRKKSQKSPPTASNGFPSKKSGIPRPTEVTILERKVDRSD
ncbi:hypothetical protein MMC29_004662 [Sticta canariensis]|nr:hypothetical protein [Sticta canariensis]